MHFAVVRLSQDAKIHHNQKAKQREKKKRVDKTNIKKQSSPVVDRVLHCALLVDVCRILVCVIGLVIDCNGLEILSKGVDEKREKKNWTDQQSRKSHFHEIQVVRLFGGLKLSFSFLSFCCTGMLSCLAHQLIRKIKQKILLEQRETQNTNYG